MRACKMGLQFYNKMKKRISNVLNIPLIFSYKATNVDVEISMARMGYLQNVLSNALAI